MITVYLNDRDASYIDLKSVEVKGGGPWNRDRWSNGAYLI